MKMTFKILILHSANNMKGPAYFDNLVGVGRIGIFYQSTVYTGEIMTNNVGTGDIYLLIKHYH
jgi:hypothetical protein